MNVLKSDEIMQGFSKMGAMIEILFVFTAFLVSENIDSNDVDNVLNELMKKFKGIPSPMPQVSKEAISDFQNLIDAFRDSKK